MNLRPMELTPELAEFFASPDYEFWGWKRFKKPAGGNPMIGFKAHDDVLGCPDAGSCLCSEGATRALEHFRRQTDRAIASWGPLHSAKDPTGWE